MLTTVPTGEQLAEAIAQLNDIVAAIGARGPKADRASAEPSG
jgi:hypothetical protein